MAREIRSFAVTIPANTPIANNFTADLSFPPRIVEEIEVEVPPGPRGEVGFSIGSSGVPIIPFQPGVFIITDNEIIHWPVQDQHDSGSWTFFGYNTGSFPHTLYVRFLLVPVQAAVSPLAPGGGAQPGGAGPGRGPGGGLPPPGGLPVPPRPPRPPPPPAPPGAPGAPLILPPRPPRLGPALVPPVPDAVLLGVRELAQVWLLEEGRYQRLTSFAVMNALLAAGLPGVEISTGFHDSLIKATGAVDHEALMSWLLGGLLEMTGIRARPLQ